VNAVRIVLIVLEVVVGLTATGGGIALACGLEGQAVPGFAVPAGYGPSALSASAGRWQP